MKNKHTLVIVLFVALFIVRPTQAAESKGPQISLDLFLAASAKKESGNDLYAIGDKHLEQKAYGFLQIRQPCVDDVNRRHGTTYKAQDMLGNRALSIWVWQEYLKLYATRERLGREPTYQDMARIWNGGPLGAFDNGAINKQGTLHKNPRTRANIARAQANAKRYSIDLLKILGPMYAQR